MEDNFLISIIALIIAIFALFISYKAIRYQIISLLNVQLSDKAKYCNDNLDKNNLSKMPTQIDKFSGILSAIITAEELFNYQFCYKKSIFLWFFDCQSLIDQFYLQLHTTIRVFLQKGQIQESDIDDSFYMDIFQKQYNRATEFLSISIAKDKNRSYEKLHSYSLKRNKKLFKKYKL